MEHMVPTVVNRVMHANVMGRIRLCRRYVLKHAVICSVNNVLVLQVTNTLEVPMFLPVICGNICAIVIPSYFNQSNVIHTTIHISQ